MASVFTIEGASGGRCDRVPTPRRPGKKADGSCTIQRCKDKNGRWKFKKGTKRCR